MNVSIAKGRQVKKGMPEWLADIIKSFILF